MNFLYFDPTIGAMIVQAIVAAVAGVLLFSKNLLFKIKLFLGIIKPNEKDLFDDIDIENTDVKNSDIENKKTSDS